MKTIKIDETTKKELDKIKGNNTYNEIVSKLLISTEYNDFLEETNYGKQALFCMGLLTYRIYGDDLNNHKLFDEVKKISKDNFMKIYTTLVAKDNENNSSNEFLIGKISELLLKSKNLSDVTGDDFGFYFTLGFTAKSV